MKNLKTILAFLLAAFMIFGGVNHFLKPDMYTPFIPSFMPVQFVNYASGILEIILGIGVFIPQYQILALKGILVLMLIFLPIHIVDVFVDNPSVGSHKAALIRLPFQFLFIAWAWFLTKE